MVLSIMHTQFARRAVDNTVRGELNVAIDRVLMHLLSFLVPAADTLIFQTALLPGQLLAQGRCLGNVVVIEQTREQYLRKA